MKTVLLTGKGRSGTTWLAQILNTYVHCSYKHEPFLGGKDTPWNALVADLDRDSVDVLRDRYRKLARSAVHGVDMPPFPPKSVRHQHPRVMHALYAAGSRLKLLRPLYEVYAKPHMHEEADVLIKDVNFPNERLARLCEVIDPHLVPIVRNPFANIASHTKGVELGYFDKVTAEDKRHVRDLIREGGDPTLLGRAEELDRLTALQFETVRWRLQVEPLLAFAKRWSKSHVVVYEDLCADPIGQTEKLFAFLDWKVNAGTREFLEASTSGGGGERSAERAYYSVYRDPRESLDKWRKQLSSEQQAEIASIFRESPYRGLWRDLP